MKKKLIFVVLLLIVITVAALPYVNGILLEGIMKKAVEDANAMQANNPFGYSFEITDYERGYSSTDIRLKIDLGKLKELYGLDSVIVKEHAKHGILGVTAEMNLEDNPGYMSFVNEKLDGKDPLHIETRYSIFGSIESDLVLDEFSVDLKDENLNVKKAEMEVKGSRGLKNFEITGNWQGFNAGEKASVGEATIDADMEMVSKLIYEGDAVVAIESFKVKDKNADFEISDIKMETDTDIDNDANNIDFDVTYSIGSVQSKGFNIEDINAGVSLNGVKLDAYEEFRDQYLNITSRMMANMPLGGPAKMNDEETRRQMVQMSTQMMAAYEKLLKKGLEIKLFDVHAKLLQGKINGDITIKLLRDMTIAQFAPLLMQPETLLDIIYINTDITLPLQLVGENPKMLQPGHPRLKTGLFVKEGDNLVHRMETKEGKLLLNGSEVPLAEMAPRFGGQQPSQPVNPGF